MIREARRGDAAAMAPLIGELGYPSSAEQVEKRLERLLALPGAVILVAAEGAGLLGVAAVQDLAVLHHDGNFAQLMLLVVAAAARRRGVGRALVEASERWARDRGCVRLLVATNLRRADAHAFYEELGFEHTSRRYTKVLDVTGGGAPS